MGGIIEERAAARGGSEDRDRGNSCGVVREARATCDHQDRYDPDERAMKSVRVKAPSFDGRLDPKAFLDWVADMDHYFE